MPVRVALDIGWDDPTMPKEALEAKCLRYKFGRRPDKLGEINGKFSLLAFATMCRSVKVIERLATLGINMTDVHQNGMGLGEACVSGDFDLEALGLPLSRASRLETLSCLIRHGYRVRPPKWAESSLPALAHRDEAELPNPNPEQADLLRMIVSDDALFDTDLFNLLVAEGYDPLSRRDGRDYLDIAITNECHQGVDTLTSLWLDSSSSPTQQQLAYWLEVAVRAQTTTDVIRRLLDAGADPFYRISGGSCWDTLMGYYAIGDLNRFSSVADTFTKQVLRQQAKLWEPNTSREDPAAVAKRSRYFHIIVALAKFRTITQWVSDGWGPNTRHSYDGSHFEEIVFRETTIRVGLYNAYEIVQETGRTDVVEYFDALGVEIEHLTYSDHCSSSGSSLWGDDPEPFN